jgi:hypothetical protein
MSGQVRAEQIHPADQESGHEDVVKAKAARGWWIVPCVAFGAAIWALIISWAFGLG